MYIKSLSWNISEEVSSCVSQIFYTNLFDSGCEKIQECCLRPPKVNLFHFDLLSGKIANSNKKRIRNNKELVSRNSYEAVVSKKITKEIIKFRGEGVFLLRRRLHIHFPLFLKPQNRKGCVVSDMDVTAYLVCYNVF